MPDEPGPGADLTIGALSRRTGVKVETIRYYERIDLMPAPPRSAGGHRVYREQDLRRLAFIRRSRELGFALGQVRSLLGLVDSGAYTCAEVQAITLGHLAEVRHKIRDLRRLADVLARTAARCTGDTSPDCPVIDALYREPR